ncbi:MAG: hypothetical protein F4Y94_00005 [Chloroflexi bacterium]|nr:hypothetical protein [Chloroflexota bacterium]
MATQSELDQRIAAFSRDLDDEQLELALTQMMTRLEGGSARMLKRIAGTWSAEQDELLDVATQLLARHSALAGSEPRLRSLLELVVSRHELAQRLGGGPRHVLDEFEHHLLLQAQIAGEAMRAIWDEPMLPSREAAQALGAKPENRERVRRYRERSWLLGLPSGRGYLFPAFQFDVARRDVAPEVRSVNEHLDAVGDPWGVASWWVSRNDRLGARPCDLVGTERADDLAMAAHAVTEPIG